MLVPKKDGKVQMCMDYQDLSWASPKDNFPLPHVDILVDNMTNFALFSFMDGTGEHGEDDFHHPVGNFLLQSDVLWAQEHRGNLLVGYGSVIPRHDAQRDWGLRGWHDC